MEAYLVAVGGIEPTSLLCKRKILAIELNRLNFNGAPEGFEPHPVLFRHMLLPVKLLGAYLVAEPEIESGTTDYKSDAFPLKLLCYIIYCNFMLVFATISIQLNVTIWTYKP